MTRPPLIICLPLECFFFSFFKKNKTKEIWNCIEKKQINIYAGNVKKKTTQFCRRRQSSGITHNHFVVVFFFLILTNGRKRISTRNKSIKMYTHKNQTTQRFVVAGLYNKTHARMTQAWMIYASQLEFYQNKLSSSVGSWRLTLKMLDCTVSDKRII